MENLKLQIQTIIEQSKSSEEAANKIQKMINKEMEFYLENKFSGASYEVDTQLSEETERFRKLVLNDNTSN